MNGDLISRGDLLDEIEKARLNNKHTDAKSRNQHNQEYTHFGVIANRQPTIEAAPVVHGYNDNQNSHEADEFKCSVCGLHLEDWSRRVYDEDADDEYWVEYAFKYCPNCGAKMKGGTE